MSRQTRTTGLAAVCLAAIVAGCGGGGGSTGVAVALQSVAPDTSTDLNGGDVIEIRGRGFTGVTIARVKFVGASTSVGFGLEVVDDGMLRVTTPPAPSGSPGPVTIEVEYRQDDETRFVSLFAGYTYLAPSLPPDPQVITPTTYVPTGAASFTIQGTNLGSPGGTVNVRFAGVGTVRADVSADATIVSGRAPVAPAAPPSGAIDVFVEPDGGGSSKVPTAVQFAWSAPVVLTVRNQATDAASRPVRLDETHAVVATAGGNGTWGDADDDLVLLTGPTTPSATPIRMPNQTPVGYLDPTNSIPAVLDSDSLCVYSVGPDGTPGSIDDSITRVANVKAATAVFNPVVIAMLNPAPVVAISSTRVVTTGMGPDGAPGTSDDQILMVTFGTSTTMAVVANAGAMDTNAGRASWSLPMSPDGNLIYVMGVGADGARGTGDDVLWSLRASALPASGFVNSVAPNLVRPPVWVGDNTLAAPAGNNGAPGGANDWVVVFNDGATLSRTGLQLQTASNPTSLRGFAAFGDGLFAVGTAGLDATPNSGDERIRVYTDLASGAFNELAVNGAAHLVPLPNGALCVFGPGPNFTPGDADDAAGLLDATASVSTPFAPSVTWTGLFDPLVDENRVFLVTAGLDNTVGTGDEELLVHQSLAVGATVNTARLPLAVAPTEPLTGAEPYVPVGADWGVIQSPGADGVYGTGDDRILVARH